LKHVPNDFFCSFLLADIKKWITRDTMNISGNTKKINCEVCGGSGSIEHHIFVCSHCGFKKNFLKPVDDTNNNLIFAADINAFFKNKYYTLSRGETFELSVPVRRFYKNPSEQKDQVNFFTSKNIMFLLEQHGFQFVSRKSRFSTTLDLIVRKV